MTDYIEILQKKNLYTELFDLHDFCSDVKCYFDCASSDIGEVLEQRIRFKCLSAMRAVTAMRGIKCNSFVPDALEDFIGSIRLMIDDNATDREIMKSHTICEKFLAEHTLTIKDH